MIVIYFYYLLLCACVARKKKKPFRNTSGHTELHKLVGTDSQPLTQYCLVAMASAATCLALHFPQSLHPSLTSPPSPHPSLTSFTNLVTLCDGQGTLSTDSSSINFSIASKILLRSVPMLRREVGRGFEPNGGASVEFSGDRRHDCMQRM